MPSRGSLSPSVRLLAAGLVALAVAAPADVAQAINWRKTSPPVGVIEAADGTATKLFVGGGGTVARLDTPGTWSSCAELPNQLLSTWGTSKQPLRLAASRTGKGVVVIGTTGQLARSTDCTQWTLVGATATGLVSSGGRILTWRGTTVRASDDGGVHWQTLATGLPTPLGGLRLVGAPGLQGTVVALLGTSGRVACSIDRGTSFRLTDATANGAAVDASGTVWIGIGTGLARSSDGCRNWTRVSGPGLPNGVRVVGAGPGRVWGLDAKDRLWRFDGTAWSLVVGAGTPTGVVDGLATDGLILGGRLRLVGDGDAALADGDLHLLGRTTTVLAASSAPLLVAVTAGEVRFLAAGNGRSWVERRFPKNVDPDAVRLFVTPKGRLLVIDRASQRIIDVSTNAGASWKAQSGDAKLLLASRPDPVKRTRLWVVGSTIRYSDTDGKSWRTAHRPPWRPTGLARPIAISKTRSALLIDDARAHKAALSTDAGKTWTRIPGVPDDALVIDGGGGMVLSWSGSELRRMVPGVGWKRWETGLPEAISYFPYRGPLVVLPSGAAYLGLRGALWTRTPKAHEWKRVDQSPQRITGLIPTAAGLLAQADAKVRLLVGAR